MLDAEGVKRLASLPSLDELRAKLVGLAMAPATKVAAVLQAPAGQLARVMGAKAKPNPVRPTPESTSTRPWSNDTWPIWRNWSMNFPR